MSSLFHGKFNLARQNSTNNESSKCSPVEKVELLRQISTGSQKSYGSNYEYNSDSEIEDEGTKEEQTDLNESKFTNFTDEAEKNSREDGSRGRNLSLKVTPTEIIESFIKDAVEVASACDIGEGYAMKVLQQCNYNVNVALTRFFENEHDTSLSQYRRAEVKLGENGPHMCFICYNSRVEDKDYISLGCGHYYCRDCWVQFLSERVIGASEVFNLMCMDPDCNVHLSPTCLNEVMYTYPESIKRYNSLLAIKVIRENRRYTTCPAAECECVIELTAGCQEGECPDCGYQFCVHCSQEGHSPSSCEDLKKWKKLSVDSSTMDAAWLQTNTKDCPKCKNAIEKNGGCNHMTCRSCMHEFCWLCLRKWNGHTFCNTYAESVTISENRKRIARYAHFWERYTDHCRSAKNVEMLRAKASMIADDVDSSYTVIKVGATASEYLQNAVNVLTKCHKMLAFTYVFAYFMEDEAQQTLFEYQQAELTAAVENLNFYVEYQYKDGPHISNLCRIAVTRANHIRDAAVRGVFSTDSAS